MESKKKNKLPDSKKHLEEALRRYDQDSSDLNFLTLSKAFEILIEYAWRRLKFLVEDQGLEAPAPKIAVKQAAKLKLIKEPEKWLDCIDARNDSVHDYFGISNTEYVQLTREFLTLVQDLS